MDIKQMRSHVRSILRRMDNDSNQLGEVQFTDAELTALINEAYRLFLMETEILRESASVTVTSGIGTLPDGTINVDRVEISNVPIGQLSRRFYTGALPG